MMLYQRGETTGTMGYRIDQLAIYLATIYPLVFWQTYPREFQWFSDFDVLRIPSNWTEMILRVMYIGVLILFSGSRNLKHGESAVAFRNGSFMGDWHHPLYRRSHFHRHQLPVARHPIQGADLDLSVSKAHPSRASIERLSPVFPAQICPDIHPSLDGIRLLQGTSLGPIGPV